MCCSRSLHVSLNGAQSHLGCLRVVYLGPCCSFSLLMTCHMFPLLQLSLIRRTFSSSVSIRAKKLLYLSLVRSQLTYCCQIWRPHLIKDITFERIQRRATKFILNDFSADYKTRLISLSLLPLMFLYELFDVLFFVKCLKFPDPSFVVKEFISFSTSSQYQIRFSC